MAKENVAIILAVSDYGPTNSLTGCENDAALIKAILEKTGKFPPDNCLFIDEDTSSGAVKGALSRFIGGLKGRDVGEIFYFYSGHGLFDGTDFYYLLSDYQTARTQVTTLANAELDEMLRSLGADLTVKVIDACYSAQQYVKSPDDFEKAIRVTSLTYKNCYFMFSSEQTQASWQDSNFSYFTLEFAKAIEQHSSSSIRYKDIIDFVSDSFAPNARQRPVFVAQANFTEEFCTVDESMRQMISDRLSGTISKVSTPAASILSVTEELKQRIQKDAERYGTAEDAEKMFEFIKDIIEGYELPDPLADLYSLKRTFMSEQYQVPNATAIGQWLENNPGDFFGEVLRSQESYDAQEPVVRLRNAFDYVTSPSYPEYRTVTKYRLVISGFDSTERIPLKAVHVVAEPRLQNVPWWKWYCAFVVSKTEIACFETHVRLKEINWQEQEEQGKVQWTVRKLPMKDSGVVRDQLDKAFHKFTSAVTDYLMEKYALEEKNAESPSPS